MKILFDHQAFEMQRLGGVSNSFVQLISKLPSHVDYQIALFESDNVHLRDSGLMEVAPMKDPASRFILNRHFFGQGILYEKFGKIFPSMTSCGRNRLYAIKMLKQGDFDIFHPTFFDDYFVDYLNGKPFVLTVHDMIPELFFKKNDKQTVRKKRLVHQASHIIAVSENTKSDIMELLGVPEHKISVIYHGAPDVAIRTEEEPLVDHRYILYVGDRKSYKNFMPMMEALTPVLSRDKGLYVVCTGNEFSQNEKTFFQERNISDQIIHIRPKDNGMMNLYAHALCFIYPSLYEGFGIPILEAYQANCPVLLNEKSCFPEIARDAAVYFNLDQQNSNLTEVVTSFLSQSQKDREQLIKRQQLRLSNFSWEKSARQLTQVYESVLC